MAQDVIAVPVSLDMSHSMLTSAGPASYGIFQCRPASLRTCGMNESGDLERGLPRAVGAELHGAAGGRSLRDRKRRASLGEERQPDPAKADGRAGGGRPDRGQLETVHERREPPD